MRGQMMYKKFLCRELVRFDYPETTPKPFPGSSLNEMSAEGFLKSPEGKPYLDRLIAKLPETDRK
jgi:hypothetical protein